MSVPTPEAAAALAERVVALKLLPRTGWLQRGVSQAESVAEHSFGVAVLALALADAAPGADRGRLLALALLHDMAEALLGDWPSAARRHLPTGAKQAAERGAMEELVAQLPAGGEFLALWEEYSAGASVEARLVKALDRLELLAQALAYERAGSRNLAEFWQGADQGWEEFPALGEVAAYLAAHRPG